MGIVLILASACAPASESHGSGTSWVQCGDGFECANLEVPLDHDRPGGTQIQIALKRLRAHTAQPSVLFIGAGGPGDSGRERLTELRSELAPLRARYDLIGFDPRGVGASTPAIRCLDDSQLDSYFGTELVTPAAHEAAIRYADACQANSQGLLPFVGTENVARDLEALRQSLGQPTLNYLGFSYGTRVGLSYMEQFPDRVGRMVLDSVDNPTDPPEIDAIIARPAKEDEVAAWEPDLEGYLADLAAHPRRASDGRFVNASVARTALYHAPQRIDLADTDEIQRLADEANGRDPDGTYDPGDDAYVAVNCLVGDPGAGVPDRAEAAKRVDEIAAAAAREAPIFGAWLVYRSEVCDLWPVAPTFAPHDIHAPGAPPVLLLNNSDDTVTTLEDARDVAADLADAALVVRPSGEHGVYLRADPCVDSLVNAYLLGGAMPAEKETRCDS